MINALRGTDSSLFAFRRFLGREFESSVSEGELSTTLVFLFDIRVISTKGDVSVFVFEVE